MAALVARGSLRVARKEHDKAVADFDEAVRLDPASAAAFEGRGNAWKAAGNAARAGADLARARELARAPTPLKDEREPRPVGPGPHKDGVNAIGAVRTARSGSPRVATRASSCGTRPWKRTPPPLQCPLSGF